MNSYIESLDSLPISVWNGISINIWQTVLLTGFIVSLSYWLIEKKKTLLWLSAAGFVFFISINSYNLLTTSRQAKLIVYNIPGHRAVDLVAGKSYGFICDSLVANDKSFQNFNVGPSRTLYGLTNEKQMGFAKEFRFCDKKILFIDSAIRLKRISNKEKIDIIVLSGNPKLYLTNLTGAFIIDLIVIDSSVPVWKAKLWKKDCDSLHIKYHDVSGKGAFVMNL